MQIPRSTMASAAQAGRRAGQNYVDIHRETNKYANKPAEVNEAAYKAQMAEKRVATEIDARAKKAELKADSYIKNAFTGHIYPYRVGSLDSLQLYKVMDSTGIIDNNGVKLNKMKRPNSTTNALYYDNPEEYMNHRRIKLNKKLYKV